MSLLYFHLPPGSPPPAVALSPFRAVVVIEDEPDSDWQQAISRWLVHAGCLYMMAWGTRTGSWDDSVDFASLERFNYEAVPEDRSIMTTWHDHETLEHVFWFAKELAFHSTIELEHTVLIHVAQKSRERELLQAFDQA